jgi:hypothetical protein
MAAGRPKALGPDEIQEGLEIPEDRPRLIGVDRLLL